MTMKEDNLEKMIMRHIEELNRIIGANSLTSINPEIFIAKSNALLALSNMVSKVKQERKNPFT